MTSRRRLPVLLASLALVAGCGGGDDGGGVAASFTAGAEFAPAEAPLFAALDTDLDSDQWNQLEELIRRFPDHERALRELREGFDDEDATWDEIRPTLGQAAYVVLLDFEDGGDNFVGFTKPGDQPKFEQLLERGEDPSEHRRIDGWTVFADTEAALDRFEQARTGEKLADDETFSETVEKLPDDALATVYVGGEGVRQALSGQAGLETVLPALKNFESGAMALTAEDNGVRLEGVARTSEAPEAKDFASTFIDEVPGDALVFAAFHGTEDGEAAESVRRLRDDPRFGTQFTEIERLIGVKLDDLLPLFAGEGAFYVRPGTPFPEFTVLLETKEQARAQSTIDELAGKLGGLLNASPQPDPAAGVEGAKVVAAGPISVRYAVFDGKLVVTTGPRGIAALRDDGQKLGESERFEEAVDAAKMPDETAGFFYIDLAETLPVLTNFASLADEELPTGLEANIRPLRSMLAYSTVEPDPTFSLFLGIGE